MTVLTGTVDTWVAEFPKAAPLSQQSIARTLGMLGYRRHPHGVVKALNCLLNAVDKKSPGFSSNIDARQNAFDALPKILTELGASLSRDLQPLLVNRIFEVFLAGLDDYTTDQRGDVGSWLRMSSIRGAVSVVTLYRQLTQDLDSPEAWLPSKLFRDIVAGIFKQAAERLDNVRQVAVDGIVGLLQCEPMDGPGRWTLQGEDAIRHELIELADPLKSWGDGSWTFPKLVHFLVIEEYRQSLLLGFVMSIGSRGEGAAHPASTSLVEFAVSLPATVENGFSVQSLAQDVLKVMLDNATSNIIFIPTLQTFIVLLEGRILDKVASTSAGVDVLRALLACAVRNMGNAKSAQRVMTAAKLVSGLVGVPAISAEAAKCIPTFLCHKFPKVRTSTAEDLYLAIQSLETEVDGEVEELLLETTWNTAVDDLQEPAGKIVAGLLASATLD